MSVLAREAQGGGGGGVSFTGVHVLAPMVRVSTLPVRLLALDYGADLVWTEEIVAAKIAKCERIANPRLGTIEFFQRGDPQRTRVFQTCARERGRVVFQVGVSTPEEAVAACRTVAGDVAAFEINMGCPKHFSVQGGMGAALLDRPQIVAAIVTALKKEFTIPITAKVRLLGTVEETMAMMQNLERSGIDAITVHCRYKDQRPREPAHWGMLKALVECVKVPVLGNGDVYTYKDALRWREESGCAGIMIARGAVENPSCFRKEGMLPVRETIEKHMRYCIQYEEVYQNVKYLYQRFFNDVMIPAGQLFLDITHSKSLEEMARVLDQHAYFEELSAQRGPPPEDYPFSEEDSRDEGSSKCEASAADNGDEESARDAGGKRRAPPAEAPEKRQKVDSGGGGGGAPAGAERAFVCPECAEAFPSRNAIGRHWGETKHRRK